VQIYENFSNMQIILPFIPPAGTKKLDKTKKHPKQYTF